MTHAYTVVPIYKANLLEEQLSKKQLELSRMEEQLQATYEKVRSGSVRQFLWARSPECTGLLDLPESVGQEQTIPSYRRLLTFDVASCLTEGSTSDRNLAQLRPADRVFFFDHLRKIIPEIEADQERTLSEAEQLRARALREPAVLPDQGGGLTFLERYAGQLGLDGKKGKQQLLSARIRAAQHHMAMDWGDRARDKIDALQDLSFRSE